MLAIARATLGFLAVLQGLATRDATPPEAVPIIKVGESVMDLHSSGITATSCLVVRRDSSFHLEKRFQRLPGQKATLHIYEATLNAFEMGRLESILDSPQLRNLGEYRAPKFPVAVSTIAVVQAKIMRGEKVQSIGYFAWNKQPGSADDSPESTPEEVKQEWQASRVALSPLVGWLHEMEGRTWQEVDQSHFTLCEVASMEK